MRIRSFLLSTLLLSAPLFADLRIAVQPLGAFDSTLLERIAEHIRSEFPTATVTVLAAVGLPKAAYYAPRQRYRAEKLLEFLRGSCRATFTKIVGITEVDISTTKGEYYDWGIFGLGTIGGPACVVSSFRLKGKVSAERFLTRLRGTVTHEFGHTFGLRHCPTKRCVMEDAKGTVKTVDASTGEFCSGCSKLLDITLSTY